MPQKPQQPEGLPVIATRLKAAREALGLSQADLAERVGMKQTGIGSIESGESRRPRRLLEIARAVRRTPEWLLGEDGGLDSMDVAHLSLPAQHIESEQVASGISSAPMPPLLEGGLPPDAPQSDLAFDSSATHDLPMFASVEGGPGEMVVTNEPIGFLPRPNWLEGHENAYAVRVTGTSMIPRYEPGEVVYVDPDEPLQRDKDAIFISEHDGEFRASIKRLVRWENYQWYVRQFNPRREGWWPKKQWPKAYRVLGRRDS